MARKRKARINEKGLSKGEIRKLNALRKSLGEDIADKAFAEWLDKAASAPGARADKNAALIAETLAPLIRAKKLRVPRGGYVLKRGRGRIIVSPPE